MEFFTILIELFKFLTHSFIDPLFDFLFNQYGINLSDIPITLGFGSITWFSTDLQALIVIVFSIFVDVFVLRLIYLVIRSFVRLFRR